MLLFIGNMLQLNATVDAFKYISCYCLSVLFCGQISSTYNSNTSHVIVYLYKKGTCHIVFKFKYISCYCLSEKQLILAKDTLKFKYISCYCLSDIIMLVDEDGLNSNTSHVIVYRATPWTDQQILVFKYISCYCLSSTFLL